MTGCGAMLRSQAVSDPVGGPCVAGAADGGPSCQENCAAAAAAGTD